MEALESGVEEDLDGLDVLGDGMCGLPLVLHGFTAHEADVNVNEQLEVPVAFLIGRVDGPCGVGCYDIKWGRGRLVCMLGLPGERGAACFSDYARHPQAAALCWRKIVEKAIGVGEKCWKR